MGFKIFRSKLMFFVRIKKNKITPNIITNAKGPLVRKPKPAKVYSQNIEWYFLFSKKS
jgi:hypothetical protein